MSKQEKLNIDPRLDAEDCTHHCPIWLTLSLASFGIVALIGHQIFG
ncbi:hypothetical protein [Microvirga arsenatis]|uniref:Uncharacterized protein n=1 Tax=Microvirga arsenatis TaxID=2692265 RepID=A0ABW9Z2Z2_9HYPH|nr:hypothetical protein [Microvirga arsenatis]NBJ13586.1 hypothetical protein [Microvirga arsenatis]NBJ27059.1 hypothetical protein [Microvirga arsenatis]